MNRAELFIWVPVNSVLTAVLLQECIIAVQYLLGILIYSILEVAAVYCFKEVPVFTATVCYMTWFGCCNSQHLRAVTPWIKKRPLLLYRTTTRF